MSSQYNINSSRRDSWPPTQLRLARSISHKTEPQPLLQDIDQDPLTYFLTPAVGDDGMDLDDEDEHMMDFDAGIEDASHPRQIVRSLSPSSLQGLRRPTIVRQPSPDFDSDDFTSEDEDDDEEYIRFSPSQNSLFLNPAQILYNSGVRSRSPVFSQTDSGYLSPASYPGAIPQAHSLAGRRSFNRSFSARARQGHLWREPSPDVWSIQEETEEELQRDVRIAGRSPAGNPIVTKQSDGVPKLKKKVRFILPPKQL